MAPFPKNLEHLDSSLLVEGYEYVAGEGYAVYAKDMIKSPNDECNYRLIRLSNGMEVCLVNDPKAEKSAASLSVRVGHLSDPDELPGLAHFCEHLLFMGSEKFPGENDYSEWLAKHTGSSNAYTSTDQTVYFFDVMPNGYKGALDRFSQFFKTPLFKESAVEREIKAVDSEHAKNLQDDTWRMMQLERSLTRAGHPYKKFGTGSLETLWTIPRSKGIDVRGELLKFHERHYSANLMKLVLVSKDSLDNLADLAASLFSEVVDKHLPPAVFPNDPYESSLFQTRLSVKTVKDSKAMMVQFPFFDQTPLLGSRPASLISYWIGHEGENGLYSRLKNLGLVTALSAHDWAPAPGISFFTIGCRLTAEGLAQHRTVVAAIFEYLALLKSVTYPQWAFDEQRLLMEQTFRFQEADDPSSLAVGLSENMQEAWPRRNELLSAPYTLKTFDAKEVAHALQYLTHTTCRIRLASKGPVEGLTWDNKEQWYGTEYAIDKLPESFFEPKSGAALNFALPQPNEYIASQLDLMGPRDVEQPLPRPLCIKRTLGLRAWFKQDDLWKVPRASILFKLSHPLLRHSHLNKLLTRFFVDLVNDALAEKTYDANCAGMGYGFGHSFESLHLSVSGYNQKLLKLLKVVLRKIKLFKGDAKRFAVLKETYLSQLDNTAFQSPLSQAGQEFAWLVSAQGQSVDEQRDLINTIELETVTGFVPKLLSKFYVEVLGHGNITKGNMFDAVNLVEEALDYDRLPKDALHRPRTRLLPQSCNYAVQVAATDTETLNSGIAVYCHVGHSKQEDLWCRLLLLSRLIREPCFDTLRTQEQLGYIVGSGLRTGASHIGLAIQVQSEKSPVHLEQRVEAFLNGFAKTLENMDESFFENVKSGLVNEMLEPHRSQAEETQSYWGDISGGLYDFFGNQRTAALIGKLEKGSITAFYGRYILNSPGRTKLSIHVYSQRLQPEAIAPVIKLLEEHSIAGIESLGKDKPKVQAFREAVEKVLDEKKDLHKCCREEILSAVDELSEIPDLEKDLPGVTAIAPEELRELMKIGEPCEPVTDFYDGVAKL